MRILVIQLARSNDILQTLPTLAGLKRKFPNCHIDLVVRETFQDVAKLFPIADRTISLPLRAILKPLINEKQKVKSLATLITWIADEFLEATYAIGPYDLTLNLTFSESSSFLTEIIPSKERRGLRRAFDGAYAINDPWSSYTYSQVLRHNLNILHLNDIFARIAGVAPAPISPVVHTRDPGAALPPLTIGIHIGASHSNKSLNPKIWGILSQEILEALPDAHLLFFGSKEDKKRSQIVMNAINGISEERYTNLVGRLKLHDMTHWIKKCAHVITPDTFMNQLAPACGVNVINISVGDVNPYEVGPYGEEHFVLRPQDTTLEQGLRPLVEAILSIVMGESINSEIPAFKTKLIRCSDETVRCELTPVNFRKNDIRNFFEQAYYLLAEFRNSGHFEDIPIPKLDNPDTTYSTNLLIASYDALCAVKKLSTFGSQTCVQMIKNAEDTTLLKSLGKQITEIEGLLKTLQTSVVYIKPLVDTWEVAKENVIGDSVTELAARTEGTFRELTHNVEMIQELLQLALNKNIENAKTKQAPQAEEKEITQ